MRGHLMTEHNGSGPDGRVEEAVAAYYEATESGAAIDAAAFLARYPDLADELTRFLADKAAFERRAAGAADSASSQGAPTLALGQSPSGGAAPDPELPPELDPELPLPESGGGDPVQHWMSAAPGQ